MPVLTSSTSASATAAATLLQLSWPFTSTDLKAAYRRASLKYHPDKAGAASTATFQQVNAAFELLQSWVNHEEPSKHSSNPSRPRACCTTGLRTANQVHDYACPFKSGHQCCPVYFFTRTVHEPTCDHATPPSPPFPPPPPPQEPQQGHSSSNTNTGTHTKQPQPCCATFRATSQFHDRHCPSASTTKQAKDDSKNPPQSPSPPPPPTSKAACCTFARRTRGLIHTWTCARNPTNRRRAAAAAAADSAGDTGAASGTASDTATERAAGDGDHQGKPDREDDASAAVAPRQTNREEREWRRQREAVWQSWSSQS